MRHWSISAVEYCARNSRNVLWWSESHLKLRGCWRYWMFWGIMVIVTTGYVLQLHLFLPRTLLTPLPDGSIKRSLVQGTFRNRPPALTASRLANVVYQELLSEDAVCHQLRGKVPLLLSRFSLSGTWTQKGMINSLVTKTYVTKCGPVFRTRWTRA